MSQASNGYVVLVTITVKPEFRVVFKEAILANAAQSLRDEPGCAVFDVAADVNGLEYCLYEVYSDRPAFDVHLASPHFQAFDGQTCDWLVSKTVNTFWRFTT